MYKPLQEVSIENEKALRSVKASEAAIAARGPFPRMQAGIAHQKHTQVLVSLGNENQLSSWIFPQHVLHFLYMFTRDSYI